MIFKQFSYADNLALLYSSGNWKDLEGTLSQDMYIEINNIYRDKHVYTYIEINMSTLSAYLQTWKLKFSHTKAVTAAFHLNN